MDGRSHQSSQPQRGLSREAELPSQTPGLEAPGPTGGARGPDHPPVLLPGSWDALSSAPRQNRVLPQHSTHSHK